MTWHTHPRDSTDEQFADGTTVDGLRIDRAMDEMVRHYDSIPSGDLAMRFTKSLYVFGWSPGTAAAAAAGRLLHPFPFLPSINYSVQVAATSGDPRAFDNPFRTKGTDIPGLTVLNNGFPLFVLQHTWSTGFYFYRPVVVTDIDLFFHTDGAGGAAPFVNTFQYGATPPGGYAEADTVEDIGLVLHTDSRFGPEDRRLNDVDVTRHRFKADLEILSQRTQSAPTADMLPGPYPGGSGGTSELSGVWVRAHNINVPIHQKARTRLDVVIPKYGVATTSSWGDFPWLSQYYTLSLTVLEEIEQ